MLYLPELFLDKYFKAYFIVLWYQASQLLLLFTNDCINSTFPSSSYRLSKNGPEFRLEVILTVLVFQTGLTICKDCIYKVTMLKMKMDF